MGQNQSNSKQFFEFYINDRVIYSEYGMRLNGIITSKRSENYYDFFQDNGICERTVCANTLQLVCRHVDPPPYTIIPEQKFNDPPPYSKK